ncbi:MAG: hypothetical protein ACK5XN_36170, partial [Bacteroidota bacterium]|jgi:hypothetical protein
MKHPKSRGHRRLLNRKYAGRLFAQRFLRYKYGFRNLYGVPWEDRVQRDKKREKYDTGGLD